MRRGLVAAAAMAITLAAGSATGQEARPGGGPPGGGAPGQPGPGHPGHMHHDGHLMMCHHVAGGEPGSAGMAPGMMRPRGLDPGTMGAGLMGSLADLPADPKQAARVLRFRSDLLRAISEVLGRHAAELEKAQ